MGTTNNGGQLLTFDFKQSGTSEGFNKLFYNLLPKGILSGGNISRVTDTTITVSPFLSFFEDTNIKVALRLETTIDASVSVSASTPFVIGRFEWLNVEDNFMDFLAVSYNDIESNDIVFGKCVYENGITLERIDYSRKTWSISYYEGIQNSPYPNFLVTASEPYSSVVQINKGKAIVGGKKVEISNIISSPSIDLNITNGRKDLVTINDNSEIIILKGQDTANPVEPFCPSNYLPIAILTLPSNPSIITGDMIEYIYNNNYIGIESATTAQNTTVQSNLTAHINNQSSAHGSTPTPTAGKIAEFDNKLQLNSRGAIVTGTVGTVLALPDLSTTPVANRVPRYDSSSRLETATPSAGNDCTNKTYVDNAVTNAISTASADATTKANAKVVNNNTGTSTSQAMSQQSAKDYSDGDILDTTTLSPKTNGSVRLTGSSTTRTLSNGVFAGQEFTIINATGATKTINATGGNFTLTSARNYTKLVWNGSKWLRGMEIPIGTTVWLLTNDNPDTIFGGDWNMVGTKDRALVSGNGTTGNSTGKLPQIDGTVQLVSDYRNNAATRTPTGAFGTPVATSKITSSTSQRTLTDTFGLDFSANRSNSTKYSTSKTELIKADGTYVNGWTKVAF